MESFGAYDLEGELGRGGMGAVYRARHRATGAVRAVKFIEGATSGEAVARFRREAEALARVGGAGIVPVHETGREGGRAWIVMDLLPGGSLADQLRARGRYPWREAALLVASLARTLERCHAAGIIHRDVKPANILFDDQGNARLADFGLARDLEDARLTVSGTVIGTPGYMAPEQVDGKRASPASDVFALGVVLFELVTGERPYSGRSPAEHVMKALKEERQRVDELASVPPELEGVIARALAPKVANRTPSAAAFAQELEWVLDGGGGSSLRLSHIAALTLVAAVAVVAMTALLARRGGGGGVPVKAGVAPVESSARDRALDRAREALRARRSGDALAALRGDAPEVARRLERALEGVAALASSLTLYMDEGKGEPNGAIGRAWVLLDAAEKALGGAVVRRGMSSALDAVALRLLQDRFGAKEVGQQRFETVAAAIPALGKADPLDPVAAAALIVVHEKEERAKEGHRRDVFEPGVREQILLAARDVWETEPLLGACFVSTVSWHVSIDRSADLDVWFERVLDAEKRARGLASDAESSRGMMVRRVLEELRSTHEELASYVGRRDRRERTDLWLRARAASLETGEVLGTDWAEIARFDLLLRDFDEALRELEKAPEEERPLLRADLARRRGDAKGAIDQARAHVHDLEELALRGDERKKWLNDQIAASLAIVALAELDLGAKGEARSAVADMPEGEVWRLIHDVDRGVIEERLGRR
ncbi:MAG TPA: serine/threonine-protein kinase [Planctomycetota bacterium]|nr:serine/threonine-protein kinase [Planctomycetota bacterium]